jgi:hypothetical protein
VPADWGNKELVWTLTVHGKTEKAYAALMSEEEISERIIMTRGNLNPGEDDPNKPPAITVAPVAEAIAGRPLSLTARVTDDGLPKPRTVRPAQAGAVPTAQSNSAVSRPRGLTVTWFEYGGPAQVTFDPAGPTPVHDGQTVTTARFAAPGTYILRATANDGELAKSTEITVRVSAGAADRP